MSLLAFEITGGVVSTTASHPAQVAIIAIVGIVVLAVAAAVSLTKITEHSEAHGRTWKHVLATVGVFAVIVAAIAAFVFLVI